MFSTYLGLAATRARQSESAIVEINHRSDYHDMTLMIAKQIERLMRSHRPHFYVNSIFAFNLLLKNVTWTIDGYWHLCESEREKLRFCGEFGYAI